jgi:hypothetical protein
MLALMPLNADALEWNFLWKSFDDAMVVYYDDQSIQSFGNYVRLTTKVLLRNSGQFDRDSNRYYRAPIDNFTTDVLVDCNSNKKAPFEMQFFDKDGNLLDYISCSYNEQVRFLSSDFANKICDQIMSKAAESP